MSPGKLKLRLVLYTCLALLFHPARSKAQTPNDQSLPTFQSATRIVETDVVVTDQHGNPVRGLKKSDFHLFDNKHSQTIDSFEEHGNAPATSSATNKSGVSSNEYLLHPMPSMNVVLIDIANLGMADQIYLRDELTTMLNNRSDNTQPLAVYLRASSGGFIVQDFTSDRKLLLDAIQKAIPRFLPQGHQTMNDQRMLLQIALYLDQLPGRKNILWFSGGSTLLLRPNAMPVQDDASWRELYDALTRERIAIYPIDARGLEVVFSPLMQRGR